ncbi:MAG: glycosyltransferase [Anaerotruncus sp.]|nr:MAG: glycosyltransferase [Anaerotruncus sp.]
MKACKKQTLKDIEIICVDDGSTDSSCKIAEEFAAADSRFVVIKQQNGGAGAARNNGLRHAKGKYLSFLDSDDFFEPDMLEKAYEKAEETKADFVVFRLGSVFLKIQISLSPFLGLFAIRSFRPISPLAEGL